MAVACVLLTHASYEPIANTLALPYTHMVLYCFCRAVYRVLSAVLFHGGLMVSWAPGSSVRARPLRIARATAPGGLQGHGAMLREQSNTPVSGAMCPKLWLLPVSPVLLETWIMLFSGREAAGRKQRRKR